MGIFVRIHTHTQSNKQSEWISVSARLDGSFVYFWFCLFCGLFASQQKTIDLESSPVWDLKPLVIETFVGDAKMKGRRVALQNRFPANAIDSSLLIWAVHDDHICGSFSLCPFFSLCLLLRVCVFMQVGRNQKVACACTPCSRVYVEHCFRDDQRSFIAFHVYCRRSWQDANFHNFQLTFSHLVRSGPFLKFLRKVFFLLFMGFCFHNGKSLSVFIGWMSNQMKMPFLTETLDIRRSFLIRRL